MTFIPHHTEYETKTANDNHDYNH